MANCIFPLLKGEISLNLKFGLKVSIAVKKKNKTEKINSTLTKSVYQIEGLIYYTLSVPGGGAFLPVCSYLPYGDQSKYLLVLSMFCKLGIWSLLSFNVILGSM